ncbi:dsDNA nuclease domain-containing protein [Desulfonema limicola]|nr:dsDNA nuclease domain-containing protein [Desulfonema limicola]
MKRLPKRKKKHTKSLKSHFTDAFPEKEVQKILSPLDILAEKRRGGADSIKGFIFQCQYATFKILELFVKSDSSNERHVRLEGIEDIDIFKIESKEDCYEFIQVKSSKNKLDAGKFWGEHRVLQNFAEVYIKNPKNRFRLVHDMAFADGHLSKLDHACRSREVLSKSDLKYWKEKFAKLQKEQEADEKKEVWDWSLFDVAAFFQQINFEKTSGTELSAKIQTRLIEKYNITGGNEEQYASALYWNVFLWSKQRSIIHHQDLIKLIEAVKNDIAKGPLNPAVQNKWLTSVSFQLPEKESHYFDGKAAKPCDIVAGLPARRNHWEQKIYDVFMESDVTVIKASSGQGKSTLAWQAALKLSEEGWTPYELHWCADAEKVGSIIEFIESRIKIGEIPLIVIDGLNQTVSQWSELARRTSDHPVKYLVTTRMEDWYRFGADHSKLRLIPVDIAMSSMEAKDIHDQFKKAGKLESTELQWQTAWEQVQKQGVLIEYVYLLTHGTMMKERLTHQIRNIASEKNCAEKMEILRLISVADLCGVKLLSLSVIKSVAERIGFQGDRGEILKSLEREYQIMINKPAYVEGLHPVRSQHLSDILHETLPISDTLINILAIIEPNLLNDFCAHAPLMIDKQERVLFLEKLAEHMADKPFSMIVDVIEGLFSTDAKQNWETNKDIFDELSSKGIMNSLFILNGFPWSGVQTFKNLESNKTWQESARAHLNTIDRMVPFAPLTSDTFTFLKTLSRHFNRQEAINDLKAIGRLSQWYSRFDLKYPLFDIIDVSFLWKILQILDLEDAGEFFDSYNAIYPEQYENFIEKNKSKIVGLLKRYTNTLTITEKGENLNIEYIPKTDGKNLNEESVIRAGQICLFLSKYKRYDVDAIHLPIPGMDYFRVLDEAHKQMVKKNIPNRFKRHVNRVWCDNVLVNYECSSVYEWQKQWFEIRTKSLDLVIVCTRFIETILQGKLDKANRIAERINRIRPEVYKLVSTRKEFPKRSSDLFNFIGIEELLRSFSEWSFSWKNCLEQFLWLQKGDEREKNLVDVNTQETLRKLGNMQESYEIIMNKTWAYFDVKKLTENEISLYNRLAKTISFFVSHLKKIGKVSYNARIAVANWLKTQERNRINIIKNVISVFNEIPDISFIPPAQTIEKNNIREAIIGIKGLVFKQVVEEKILIVLIDRLTGLADIDIDFYYFVTIEGDCLENNVALRISNNFFKKIKMSLKSGERFDDSGFNKPFPVPVKKDLLETLPGICMKEAVKEDAVTVLLSSILLKLWKLSEIQQRLSTEEETENSWRQELETAYAQDLEKSYKIIKNEVSDGIRKKYKALINDAILKKIPFDANCFQQLFKEDIQSIKM